MAVGERVRVAREAAGISQKSLADKIGVSEYTIIRLEKGRRSAKSDELEKIATALDVPLSYLVGIDDGEAPMPSDVTPRQGQICVVCWDGALSAKKVVRNDDGGVTLYSDVDAFKLSAAEVAEPTRFSVWGPVVQLRRTIR